MLDAISDDINVNNRPVMLGGALIFGMASPVRFTTQRILVRNDEASLRLLYAK